MSDRLRADTEAALQGMPEATQQEWRERTLAMRAPSPALTREPPAAPERPISRETLRDAICEVMRDTTDPTMDPDWDDVVDDVIAAAARLHERSS